MSSFVVQGFLLLSGLKVFLTHKEDMPYGKYLISRILGVILPYTLCFAVYCLTFMVFYGYRYTFLSMFRYYITGDLVCHLYFIPLLFQFDLLIPVWKKIVEKFSFKVVVPVALVISLISENTLSQMITWLFPGFTYNFNDRLFPTYICYWIIGCYIGKNYDAFTESIKKNFKYVTLAFVLAFVVNAAVSFVVFNGILPYPYINGFHGIYIIATVLFLFALAEKYGEKIFEKFRILQEIDRASFTIYLYHMFVLYCANKILETFGIVAQAPSFAVRVIFVYTLTPVLCILYERAKKKLWRRF